MLILDNKNHFFKIGPADFENCWSGFGDTLWRTDEQTDGHDWFYRSLGFQPGTNKMNMIKVNSVRRDYWLLGFVYIHFWVSLKAMHTCKQIFKKIKKSTKWWNVSQFVAKTGFISWRTRFLILVPKFSKSARPILKKWFILSKINIFVQLWG